MDSFKEVNMFSCNCFFDFCLLSQSKKENFKQLCTRVKEFCNKKFANFQKSSCSCSSCITFSYKLRGIWVLKETNQEFNYVSKYVVCKNYLSFILRDIFICEYEEKKMNINCLERRTFTRCIGRFPCYYNYFRSGLLNSDYFCVNCKTFLASLTDFRLNKISLIE